MKTIDDFLSDILNSHYNKASEFVTHLGYEYGQIESYFDKLKDDYPDWLTGGKVIEPDTSVLMLNTKVL